MQKKIIALAVAGLMSGAAFAQSNVTVYGVVDAFYNNIKADGSDATTAIDAGGLSGSRIGFKGTEDLGNGLKTIFVLEYSIDSADQGGVGTAIGGWSGTTTRQSLLGLTGSWGTVVAGRAQTAAYDWAALVNPLAGTAFDQTGKAGARSLLIAGSAGRASNAFAYISPNFGGFTFAYNHARLTELAYTGPSDSYANMLSGTYSNGPIAASLIYSKATGKTLNAARTDDVTEWGLGGSYDFGVAKLFASYQTINDDIVNNSDKKWQLGVTVPFGNGKFMGTYGKASIDTPYVSTTTYDDSKGFGLVYDYNLSKRTDVYVGYAKFSNDGVGTNGIKTAILPTAGDSVRIYGAGLRHSF